MQLLIVEDEPKIAQFIHDAIQGLGYTASLVGNGAQARNLFSNFEFDLVILDILLPDDDGVKICQHFKKQKKHIPILMLTTLNSIQHKVTGLDSGADDYMTKPFVIEELQARVRALLRRNQESSSILKCADLSIDLIKRTVIRGEQNIKLTTKEFSLLEYLCRNQDRPLTRSQIAQHVWDINFDPESNIVDVYIKQIRKKLDHNPEVKLIKTIVGIGYTLNDQKT
jgi:two-component system copper resistance phosphate regulon response regulator CusR